MRSRGGEVWAMSRHWSALLETLGACDEAVRWAATQPSHNRAWETCERGDWMLWIAGRLVSNETERKAVVMAACACARLSLKHVPSGEDRPRIAIETAESWCRGEATIDQVRKARDAAYAYATAAAAAYAAAYAADAAARSATLHECADIVRRMLPMPELPRIKRAKRAA